MAIGQGSQTIRIVEEGSGWLDSYAAALERTSLGETSREVILEDSRYIADRACLPEDDPGWEHSRVRTGAVMGAVQSGKTASMIGVLARALDVGVNVAVVLAGTRTALWRQTLERVLAQLDSAPRALSRRIFIPNPRTLAHDLPGPQEVYRLPETSAERALDKGRPIIAVAMKQVDHLLHLGQTLHNVVYPAARRLGVPVRLLVIDDEADDSSVADDGLPWSSPELESFKQVPRRIVDLWEPRSTPGTTAGDHVYATYVAYTATPQANFLQDPQNPLAPRDFVASLRTPGPTGTVAERTLTYRVPEGLPGWYTGSDIYYGELANTLCVVSDPPDDEAVDDDEWSEVEDEDLGFDPDLLKDAVRAYVVAAAVRLLRSPDRIGPMSARARAFGDAREAARAVAPPSSMLIHPSSNMEAHFSVAAYLEGWWHGPDGDGGGVLADLADNEDRWREWVSSYEDSSRAVTETFEHPSTAAPRAVPPWWAVQAAIINEVVPGTRISVINSDPAADDRPVFDPVQTEAGEWQAPPNHSTIFVSGNVMSRGLTLEGLLTTLFTRSSRAPLADTQMQMQRWFGYRGSYIDLCRVFLSRDQLDLFTDYADADHALRSQVLAAMQRDSSTLPDFTVLQGRAFQATGKVSGLRGQSLTPGRRPFTKHLNPVGADDHNLAVVAELFQQAREGGHLAVDRRGLVSADPLSLLATADLLDQLRYHDHGALRHEEQRWEAVQRQADITEHDPSYPLYRAPQLPAGGVDLGSSSPYTIAAYLRFWSACLDRNVRGLLTDDDPPQRWALLNLDMKMQAQPTFRVGLRFGSAPPVSEGPMAALADALGVAIRPMARETDETSLMATWGSRGATEEGYTSDELFDYQVLREDPLLHPDGTRREGSPGLLLFHLIGRDDPTGRIAVGLSIPSGGPDHIAAVTARRKGPA